MYYLIKRVLLLLDLHKSQTTKSLILILLRYSSSFLLALSPPISFWFFPFSLVTDYQIVHCHSFLCDWAILSPSLKFLLFLISSLFVIISPSLSIVVDIDDNLFYKLSRNNYYQDNRKGFGLLLVQQRWVVKLNDKLFY